MEGAKRRCTNCKACYYCSEKCQKRNWKRIHKRVCTTDSALRPYIRVEMAIERVLAKQPPMEKAPKDARCYICLDGDDDDGTSSKLMRGCACRGDSAGFVHLECLTKLAENKGESKAVSQATSQEDLDAIVWSWTLCVNCKHRFIGRLGLELLRRFWRRYRSGRDQDLNQDLRYNARTMLATTLTSHDELTAAIHLREEAAKSFKNNKLALLDVKVARAETLLKRGKALEALELLQATLPEAKAFVIARRNVCAPDVYARALNFTATSFLQLERFQEAYEVSIELVAFSQAHHGPDNIESLMSRDMLARALCTLGREDEAKATYEALLADQTRVLGRDHDLTQRTIEQMRVFWPYRDLPQETIEMLQQLGFDT